MKKSLQLKNFFHWKNCLHWKSIFIEKNYFHWKTIFVEKITSIKKLLPLKNCFHWKNSFHWKIAFIEKIASMKKTSSIEKLFHIPNDAFKIVFNIWYKLMYENFPFLLERKLWKCVHSKGYLNQNFDIGNFHICRWFVY